MLHREVILFVTSPSVRAPLSEKKISLAHTVPQTHPYPSLAGLDSEKSCRSSAECTKQIYPFSIAKVMFKKMILRAEDPGRPKFYWCENGSPEEVRTLSFLQR